MTKQSMYVNALNEAGNTEQYQMPACLFVRERQV